MLKKSIFTLLFCAVLALTGLHANGQEPDPKEIELTDLVLKADRGLDLNEFEIARRYLSQAKEIIVQNPEINIGLQGHFNKVSGKLYMKSSFNQALEYFNIALSQFEDNPSEKARINLFIGITYYYTNDLRTAEIYFSEAKEYFSLSKDTANLAQALNNLGVIALQKGNDEAAADFFRKALLINTELRHLVNASRNSFNLDYFSDSSSLTIKNDSKSIITDLEGGGGTSGSGTTINTSGSGTVVVGSGSGGGLQKTK
jgi:tetratricopeptide (TPR) repeat protein